MAEDSSDVHVEHRKAQRAEHGDLHASGGLAGSIADRSALAYSSSLLGDARLNGRGNQPVKVALMRQMQQSYGNRVSQRYLQRVTDHASLSERATPVTPTTVQRIGESLDNRAKVEPGQGEDQGEQRRYDPDQYIAMWEAEQGRKLTDAEKETVARGCIGITALNLSGGGNPPLDKCYDSFDTAKTHVDQQNHFLSLMRGNPIMPRVLRDFYSGDTAVLFAKMFWSNQVDEEGKNDKPNPDAFQPDKATGQVDMTGYKYRARPGAVNFDYAFWDDASQSFWHANHSAPGMQVYQSTKERFAEGYADFDRTIYCMAIAKNYDPKKAAASDANSIPAYEPPESKAAASSDANAIPAYE